MQAELRWFVFIIVQSHSAGNCLIMSHMLKYAV